MDSEESEGHEESESEELPNEIFSADKTPELKKRTHGGEDSIGSAVTLSKTRERDEGWKSAKIDNFLD